MTNLTEQKGKKTHYYIKLPNGEVFIGDVFDLSFFRDCKDGDKVEVLGEVPSYEELQNQAFILKSRESEIVKLKELLKDCNQILIAYEMMAKGEYRKKLREIITQINQVLGEE